MKRRELITLLVGIAAQAIAVWAQQPVRVPTIGFLGSATASAWHHWAAGFVQRLHELGRIEGRTIAIECGWAAPEQRGMPAAYRAFLDRVEARR